MENMEEETLYAYLVICRRLVFGSLPDSSGVRLDRLYDIGRRNVGKIDLEPYSKYLGDETCRGYFLDTEFREHYRLIAYLSTLFDDALLFDIGTCLGYSALALSYNPSNQVVSYDLVQCRSLRYEEELTRIRFRIGNVLEDPRLATSPLIMLDTQHDGVFESGFYAHLRRIGFKGLLFLDDIHFNPEMESFWQSIREPKQDLTHLGHWTGSGLVDFSGRLPG